MEQENKWIRDIQRGGSRQAAERLVERYYDEIYVFVYRQTGHKEDAMDLIQNIFLAVLRALPSYDPKKASFRTWLYRIAVNEYISYRRSRSNAMLNEAADAADLQISSSVDTESRADAGMDAQTMLAQLSESERTISLLFYLEEMPIKEIVKITGMAEGTVKSHLSRARKKMAGIQ